ncbi:hypothetical protein [Sinorhizobium medicae]|nr:hypothetical protein [Sinorhizobium medicae]
MPGLRPGIGKVKEQPPHLASNRNRLKKNMQWLKYYSDAVRLIRRTTL